MPDTTLPWLSLLALGAAHGLNPAMGWLFAVGRGLQQRNRRALWGALGPLALGHALAIGVAVLLAAWLGAVLPMRGLRWLVAAALLVAGVDGLVRHRHVRFGGMRMNARELTTWSFVMASAHGAGLMVLPFVLGAAHAPSAGAMHHHPGMAAMAMPAPAAVVAPMLGVGAPLVHTLGYLGVTMLLAVAVYEKVGLRILRRAWVNLNVAWALALIGAAGLAVLA